MSIILTLLAVFAIGFFILFLFAILDVAGDKEDKIDYLAEYGIDIDEDDESHDF